MVYDCFIFFNELDLLELRLSELDAVVDRFVLVESPHTLSGKSKPLFFAENQRRFERWSNKILHVVCNDMPEGPDAWARERHQRRCVIRGLTSARPDDAIMVSDVDEIPHPAGVKSWSPVNGARRFGQLFCYYWLNCVCGGGTGTRILSYREFQAVGDAQKVRQADFPVILNGGWHFSYLGGPAAIGAKLEAYSHQELNVPRFKDPRYLACVTNLGLDLFGRSGMRFKFCPVDDRLPTTVLSQRAKYAHLIREATFHDDWYADDQLVRIFDLLAALLGRAGAVLEIGCWEGRSTIALATACFPEPLYAIDTWQGSRDESADHATVRLASERDIYSQFLTNIRLLTGGNVRPIRADCHQFLASWQGPIKFAHVDASHDYRSVCRTVKALVPHLVPGAILCGDDFATATADRADLDGGVERAVRELLPGFQQVGNLWIWRR